MSKSDLYIIAAGNGSRMRADVPKALVPITHEPNLTTTLQQIGRKFNKVFVVTNALVQDQWHRYFRELGIEYPELAEISLNVPIASGLGDGHATLQGLIAAARMTETTEDIVIAWGDVFFPHAEIIDELLAAHLQGSGLLPAARESNPYVSLLINGRMQCIAADFSKHGEHHPAGLHDQSVFRFTLSRLKTSLTELHNALWKNGHYIAPGGELSLLYSFHQLYNSATPAYVYETLYPTLSFNTVEEVSAIQREISARWRQQFRGCTLEAADNGTLPVPLCSADTRSAGRVSRLSVPRLAPSSNSSFTESTSAPPGGALCPPLNDTTEP
jgi:CTP:molybdopterin cytidylyltransferase MocA